MRAARLLPRPERRTATRFLVSAIQIEPASEKDGSGFTGHEPAEVHDRLSTSLQRSPDLCRRAGFRTDHQANAAIEGAGHLRLRHRSRFRKPPVDLGNRYGRKINLR